MTNPPIRNGGMTILTRVQVAELLDVHPQVVGRWVRREGLPAHRIGRSLRFVLSEVEAWLLAKGSASETPKKDAS